MSRVTQPGFWDRWTDHRPDDWKAARKKPRKVATPAAMPDGPCCGRCRNWDEPEEGEVFGTCAAVDCVIRRFPRGPETGTLIACDVPIFRRMRLEEVGRLPDGQPIVVKVINADLAPMRVRDWAPACSRFASAIQQEAA